MTAFELYFCATVLRGALAVLLLLAAERLLRRRLAAGFWRLLWLCCLLLMLVPQMNFSGSPFRIDLSQFRMKTPAPSLAAHSGTSAGNACGRSVLSDSEQAAAGLHAVRRYLRTHRRTIEAGTVALLPLPVLLLLLARYLRCRRMIRPLPPVSDRRVLDAWNRVLAECGPLRRPVILLDSTFPDFGPTLFGCFTRKLLLPSGALRNLPDEELELLLEHEYHHTEAGDPFVNIAALVLWALMWYNPLMLIARRRLHACCEQECDRRILARHPHAVCEYGKLLLRFASSAKSAAAFPTAIGLADSPHELSHRIRRTAMTVHNGGFGMTGRGMAVLLALLLAAPVCLIAVNARPVSSRPHAVMKKTSAAAAPEKPLLPHLVLKPLPGSVGDSGPLQCWEVVYPKEFPADRAELILEIDRARLCVELTRKPGFLLLWKDEAAAAGFRLDPASSPPAVLVSFEDAAKELSVLRPVPAANRKPVGTRLFRSGVPVTFTLRVSGLGPEAQVKYRSVPAYR